MTTEHMVGKLYKNNKMCEMTRAIHLNIVSMQRLIYKFIINMFHIHLCCFDMHELLLASSHALNQGLPLQHVARQDVYRWCKSGEKKRARVIQREEKRER